MQTQLEQLALFQQTFKCDYNTSPTLLPKETCELRARLMQEELDEYTVACLDGDLVEILDSLVDQLYILLGTAHSHGVAHLLPESFQRVHDNNMSKVINDSDTLKETVEQFKSKGVEVRTENALTGGSLVIRKADGKILKPHNFKAVDLSDLIFGKE
jgi:predicted HAD superfamily Cof-like phosphohydrolase